MYSGHYTRCSNALDFVEYTSRMLYGIQSRVRLNRPLVPFAREKCLENAGQKNANFLPKVPTKEWSRLSSKYYLVCGLNLKPKVEALSCGIAELVEHNTPNNHNILIGIIRSKADLWKLFQATGRIKSKNRSALEALEEELPVMYSTVSKNYETSFNIVTQILTVRSGLGLGSLYSGLA